MAHGLRVLAAPVKDLGLVLNTHTVPLSNWTSDLPGLQA